VRQAWASSLGSRQLMLKAHDGGKKSPRAEVSVVLFVQHGSRRLSSFMLEERLRSQGCLPSDAGPKSERSQRTGDVV